ncbi:hypothetical protein EV651_102616 [Kribbella sp. VKM Ac-2571]|uniref:DUF6401 family natural product biosynthesis protein n=1 Tax=Kribbella sp. VKM Ac-2571 TaxID=2512222 RepID=UPI00105BFD22|nr:DUF6401 family natural product biosynthesis protein [Kribbella sp. VKM Ac-2571]TDO68693.1 hypothetical protein EV651_102616 [Kribbella sp. VKM Ac-2571]
MHWFRGRSPRSESAAREKLSKLADTLATAGLTAGLAIPAVGAQIDQHAAAVRDILAFGVTGAGVVAGVVLLAGYADGVLDEAADAGWSLPEQVDWTRADWTALRLAAVAGLATPVRVGGGLPDPGPGSRL